MLFKGKIKDFIPQVLWQGIRKRIIIYKHRRIGKVCDRLIDDYYAGKSIPFPINPQKKFADENIIWQYWGQGFQNVPEAVRLCIDSVDRYKGEYQVVRLSDENISEYINFPDEIYYKQKTFLKAHFSDLLRCALLTTYGGVWIDATILLTGNLPKQYFNQGFFMFQRDDKEKNKKLWEKNFAYYWGWYKGFKVRVFNSFIYAEKGNEVITCLCNILYDYWMKYDSIPDYFFFQILFCELIAKFPDLNCPIVSDCLPHFATQSILDNFMGMSFDDALKLGTIHKASYKMSDSQIEQLKELLREADEK